MNHPRRIATRLTQSIPAYLRAEMGDLRKLSDLPASVIQEAVYYNPQTGKLFWRERPLDWFVSKRIHAVWNAQNAGKEAFTGPHRKGHLIGRIFDTNAFAHRIAWVCFYGEWPTGEVDHINGDPSDNRISNLRSVTHRENLQNRALGPNSKSGVLGVRWDAQRSQWRVQIGNHRDRVGYRFLGRFSDFNEAVAARKLAEVEFGYHPNHSREMRDA